MALAATLVGVAGAWRRAWVCDDAFISFRYAENLARGQGLVFNAGERVEGFSNFLWTLGSALGFRLHADAETWSIAWGIVFYAASIAVLAVMSWRNRRTFAALAPVIPLAALLAAVHRDWTIYASGGLETSCFTFLAILGYVLLTDEHIPRREAWAGVALGLAALSRPEGAVFAFIAIPWILASRWPERRPALAFVTAFAVIWVPFLVWRRGYYGDWLPNTFYAKSGYAPWYAQGITYLALYFRRYWVLLCGLPLCALAWNAGDARWRRRVLLALAFAIGYSLCIAHVGGDFMFARLLIPATPFYLVLLELGMFRWRWRWARAEWIVAALALAATLFTPSPVTGDKAIAGVIDEWAFWSPERRDVVRKRGEELRPFFAGLPVRVVFLGAQARMVFYSDVAVAIEGETGLTDSTIARQRLARRGRVGHEKHAPFDYLEQRGVQFAFYVEHDSTLRLDDYIPPIDVRFGDVHGSVVRWEPELMAELGRRGARFRDFPSALDGYIERMPSLPDDQVRHDYEGLRRLYFDHVPDAAREAAFVRRLGTAGAP